MVGAWGRRAKAAACLATLLPSCGLAADEIWQLTSQCTGHSGVASAGGSSGFAYSQAEMSAQLRLSVPGQVANVGNHYDISDRLTWVNGSTRLDIQVNLTGAGASWSYAVAHVHADPCEGTFGGPHYVHNQCLEETCPSPEETPENIITVDVALSDGEGGAGAAGVGTAERPWVADFDAARSVVLHNPETGAKFACCDLVPPFPELPADWTATIEAAITNKGYTYTRREVYSTTLNRARIEEHSHGGVDVQIHHPSTNTVYSLTKNASFPKGVCSEHPFSRRESFELRPNTTVLKSTASMLNFNKSESVFVPGAFNVRGTMCEKWVHNFSFPSSDGGTTTYSTSYYFPVTHWQVSRESYHRLLKRVHLTGIHGDGRKIEHFYEYIDMKPYVDEKSLDKCWGFDFAPGCGCGTAEEGDNCPVCQCGAAQQPCDPIRNCPNEVVCQDTGGACAVPAAATDTTRHLDADKDGTISPSEVASAIHDENAELPSYFKRGYSQAHVAGVGIGVYLCTSLVLSVFWVAYFKIKVGVSVNDRLRTDQMQMQHFNSGPIDWEGDQGTSL